MSAEPSSAVIGCPLAPAPAADHLLLVVLDRIGRSRLGLVWLEPGGSPCPTLTEQIPALIECDLEVGEALRGGIVERRVGVLVAQRVLLVDEIVDPGHYLLVVHRHMSSPTSLGRKPT
jgi:hypothetical protein